MLVDETLILALALFILRIVNSAIGTFRVIAITQQRRLLASALAAIEALVFALVFANVISNLSNMFNLAAYCLGFAAGNWLGMWLETRFITTYSTVNIIAQNQGTEIAAALRQRGHGVTETRGTGRDGEVTMLRSVVLHRDVPELVKCINDVNPHAFVAVEEARAIHHGWVRAARHHQR